jgi:hypothetical protein
MSYLHDHRPNVIRHFAQPKSTDSSIVGIQSNYKTVNKHIHKHHKSTTCPFRGSSINQHAILPQGKIIKQTTKGQSSTQWILPLQTVPKYETWSAHRFTNPDRTAPRLNQHIGPLIDHAAGRPSRASKWSRPKVLKELENMEEGWEIIRGPRTWRMSWGWPVDGVAGLDVP